MHNGNAKLVDLLNTGRCLDSKLDVGGICYVLNMCFCLFFGWCDSNILPLEGRECNILPQHNLFFHSKRQSTTSYITPKSVQY